MRCNRGQCSFLDVILFITSFVIEVNFFSIRFIQVKSSRDNLGSPMSKLLLSSVLCISFHKGFNLGSLLMTSLLDWQIVDLRVVLEERVD